MRVFFEAFVASLQTEQLQALDPETWDMSVYNKNSNMRCIGSHKATESPDDPDARLRPFPAKALLDKKMYYVQQPRLELIKLPASLTKNVKEPSKAAAKTSKAAAAAKPRKVGRVVDVDPQFRSYLQSKGFTVVQCHELLTEVDRFSSVPRKPAKTIMVKGVCPFANKTHKSNHCFVVVNERHAIIKCMDPECEGQYQEMDWQPRNDEAAPMQMEGSEPDEPGEPDSDDTANNRQAAIELLLWKLSHPYYRDKLAGDGPLGLEFIGLKQEKLESAPRARARAIAATLNTQRIAPSQAD
jgi:hypothetical protein